VRGHRAGPLVVAKRDRVARNVALAAEVEGAAAREGARLVSAMGEGNGDSPADAFMRTVIDGAAQYEHGLIRARTRAVLAVKRARGERVGAVPYGFALSADGVRLAAAGREQATIVRARELRASGPSLRAVASRLAAEGRVSRRGRVFLATQIARMLPPSRPQGADDGVRRPSSARPGSDRAAYSPATSTKKHEAASSWEDANRPYSEASSHEHGAPGNPAITLV
jgi:site-specific DNA recombinase